MEPAHFLGSDKRMRFDSMPFAHVVFAYKGPPAGSEHSVPIMMLKALLGEGRRGEGVGDSGRRGRGANGVIGGCCNFYGCPGGKT